MTQQQPTTIRLDDAAVQDFRSRLRGEGFVCRFKRSDGRRLRRQERPRGASVFSPAGASDQGRRAVTRDGQRFAEGR